MGAAQEHALNAALAGLHAGGGHGSAFEECQAIVDRFYADHVQVSSDATPGRLIGKGRVKQALGMLLAPLFATQSADSRSMSLRCIPIYADRHDEHHSAWSLDFIDAAGRRASVHWSVRRIWRRGLVVHEHFFESDADEDGSSERVYEQSARLYQ
jgi:hypothetical protein